jgi:hypothetical protein
MDGEFDIIDSRGKSWNYPAQSKESRPNMSEVYEFLEDEKPLYSEIEHLIIQWNNDGTKTAGSLTRDIMKLIESYEK